jgi:hypothetical protein
MIANRRGLSHALTKLFVWLQLILPVMNHQLDSRNIYVLWFSCAFGTGKFLMVGPNLCGLDKGGLQ